MRIPRDTVVSPGNGAEPGAVMTDTTDGVRYLAMDDATSRGAPRAASARFTRDTVEETATVVNVDGELDINSADALREALDAAEADGCSVLRVDAASWTRPRSVSSSHRHSAWPSAEGGSSSCAARPRSAGSWT
jgi:hypothetical protein